MFKRSNIVNMISIFMWGLAIFAYFFQFPLSGLSRLIIPCLAGYLVLNIPKLRFEAKTILLFIVFIADLVFMAVVSFIADTSISRIIRFAFILLAIVYCSFLKFNSYKIETEIFINIAMCKAFLLIAIAIAIILLGDYAVFRNWVMNNTLGDIYFFNRFMPRIQVQGNALLVIGFIVEYLQKEKITKRLLVLSLGIFFAGNFAYILGIALFIAYVIFKKAFPILKGNRKLVPFFIVFIVIVYLLALPYLLNQVEQKAELSNQARMEQAEVLLDANVIVGEGLGNYIKVSTPTRDYDGDIYFEMQTLYIVNQIGVIGLILFYGIVFYNAKRNSIESLIL